MNTADKAGAAMTTEYDEGFPSIDSANAEDEPGEDAAGPIRRERSRIKFPYGDLTGAVELAAAVGERGLDCTAGQLAAALNLTAGSGMFRLRVSSAQTFGLVTAKAGSIALTPLGRQVIDPQRAGAARAEAFLTVPLYRHIHDLFDGTVLPGDFGLEAEMVKAGVAEKQAAKARQAFTRSAEQAGFFAAGRNRLVMPTMSTVATAEPAHASPRSKEHKEASVLSDSLLAGLFERMLPAEGEEFPAKERRRFFRALAVNLDVIYGEPADGSLDADRLAALFKVDGSDGRVRIEADARQGAG